MLRRMPQPHLAVAPLATWHIALPTRDDASRAHAQGLSRECQIEELIIRGRPCGTRGFLPACYHEVPALAGGDTNLGPHFDVLAFAGTVWSLLHNVSITEEARLCDPSLPGSMAACVASCDVLPAGSLAPARCACFAVLLVAALPAPRGLQQRCTVERGFQLVCMPLRAASACHCARNAMLWPRRRDMGELPVIDPGYDRLATGNLLTAFMSYCTRFCLEHGRLAEPLKLLTAMLDAALQQCDSMGCLQPGVAGPLSHALAKLGKVDFASGVRELQGGINPSVEGEGGKRIPLRLV